MLLKTIARLYVWLFSVLQIALLGSFVCGLSLCNQHTSVIYIACLVPWVFNRLHKSQVCILVLYLGFSTGFTNHRFVFLSCTLGFQQASQITGLYSCLVPWVSNRLHKPQVCILVLYLGFSTGFTNHRFVFLFLPWVFNRLHKSQVCILVLYLGFSTGFTNHRFVFLSCTLGFQQASQTTGLYSCLVPWVFNRLHKSQVCILVLYLGFSTGFTNHRFVFLSCTLGFQQASQITGLYSCLVPWVSNRLHKPQVCILVLYLGFSTGFTNHRFVFLFLPWVFNRLHKSQVCILVLYLGFSTGFTNHRFVFLSCTLGFQQASQTTGLYSCLVPWVFNRLHKPQVCILVLYLGFPTGFTNHRFVFLSCTLGFQQASQITGLYSCLVPWVFNRLHKSQVCILVLYLGFSTGFTNHRFVFLSCTLGFQQALQTTGLYSCLVPWVFNRLHKPQVCILVLYLGFPTGFTNHRFVFLSCTLGFQQASQTTGLYSCLVPWVFNRLHKPQVCILVLYLGFPTGFTNHRFVFLSCTLGFQQTSQITSLYSCLVPWVFNRLHKPQVCILVLYLGFPTGFTNHRFVFLSCTLGFQQTSQITSLYSCLVPWVFNRLHKPQVCILVLYLGFSTGFTNHRFVFLSCTLGFQQASQTTGLYSCLVPWVSNRLHKSQVCILVLYLGFSTGFTNHRFVFLSCTLGFQQASQTTGLYSCLVPWVFNRLHKSQVCILFYYYCCVPPW